MTGEDIYASGWNDALTLVKQTMKEYCEAETQEEFIEKYELDVGWGKSIIGAYINKMIQLMRDPTPEERKQVYDYIQSISEDTGVNFYDTIGETSMNKVEIHKVICEELNKVYEAKNHDYGDSFARVRKNYPQSINIRLWDKLLRLDQLNNGAQAKVKDESIEDTLLDMANYCIMEVIERRSDGCGV